MMAKKMILGVVVFTFFGLNAQEVDSSKVTKHELGMSLDLKNGRFFPGVQYYYNLNSKSQLGVNFNMYGSKTGASKFILHPGLSLSYRRLWPITGGLRAYLAPTVSYEYLSIPDVGRYNRFGLGLGAGLEYDFSKNHLPLIIGAGAQPMLYRNFGRTEFGVHPSMSIRFKL